MRARAGRGERWSPYSFVAALHFLTTLPPLSRRQLSTAEFGQAVGMFPLVGLLLGGALAGLGWLLARLFPPGVVAALLLMGWALLTGALHLDGLMDSLDGLLGGRTPEARLRILRDEHMGAYAVTGGILLLLLKYSALASLPSLTVPLLLAPILGRWAMALAVVAYPYARAEGLGSAMKEGAGRWEAALATLVAAGAAWLLGGERGLIALAAGALLLYGVGRFTLARLPGLTGDLYGALCEAVEALTLLCFLVIWPP